MDLSEIKALIEQQGEDWTTVFTDLKTRVEQMELKAARPGGMGGSGSPAPLERKALNQAARALIAGDITRAQQIYMEAKAMSAGSDPAGGYWVMPQMSQDVTSVMLETTPLLNYVRVVDLDPTDTFEEIVDKDDCEVVWVGEADSRNDTATPDVGKLVVPVHEVYTQPKVSQKLIDSTSYDVQGWLNRKMGEAFGFAFGAAIIGGNGVARPKGFNAYPVAATGDSVRPWGTLQYIPTGASGALASTDPLDFLDDTVAALKPQYRAGAVWVMNRTTAARIRKAKDDNGLSLWQPSTQAGMPPTLKGYPVLEDDQMPDVAANSASIAFGNFRRGYVMVRRAGFRFLVDPYTDKPNVKFYAYQRVGGGVANSEAIKVVRFSAS